MVQMLYISPMVFSFMILVCLFALCANLYLYYVKEDVNCRCSFYGWASALINQLVKQLRTLFYEGIYIFPAIDIPLSHTYLMCLYTVSCLLLTYISSCYCNHEQDFEHPSAQHQKNFVRVKYFRSGWRIRKRKSASLLQRL